MSTAIVSDTVAKQTDSRKEQQKKNALSCNAGATVADLITSVPESIYSLLFENPSERKLRRFRSLVKKINQLEESYISLSDEELKAKTQVFRQRVQDGETLKHLLPEAFAVVKNTCRRLYGKTFNVRGLETLWDMIPYDEQLFAGIVMEQCGIAEMATGEGKSLAAAFPLYLHAIAGKGAHLVTVNEYLAQRDAEFIGSIFRFHDLTVGCIIENQSPEERRNAYLCDVTYGVNSEFGFDYLRDNGMARRVDDVVQRELEFAIIDEIDSVLIDEARTPLIIAGKRDAVSGQFDKVHDAVKSLVDAQKKRISEILRKNTAYLHNKADHKLLVDNLLLARLGMPKNAQLNRFLEDSTLRKEVNRADDMLHRSGESEKLREFVMDLYFSVDEKQRSVELTGKGQDFLHAMDADFFLLPDREKLEETIRNDQSLSREEKRLKLQNLMAAYATKMEDIHNFHQLLQAYCLFERDVDYVVADGKIVIVDEHTGRPMADRRYSNGLHLALEAKERVKIQQENTTYASITQQNYFRLYKKLAGMTGTARADASEFYQIYKLDVVQIPTHLPVNRKTTHDLVYRTTREKFQAIAEEVACRHNAGQPVLVGTPSVEDSERISALLKSKQIPHRVLNAKQNQEEAETIALAGQKGAVTVATNMAGCGTDIKLGQGVAALGGLCVIGSSRHDARRIDLQLQGRCSRQGDPGESFFFVSLEDPFMRLFGPSGIVAAFAGEVGRSQHFLSSPKLDKVIESAQKKLEIQHAVARKHTLDYDDVLNAQRTVVYGLRKQIIQGENADVIDDMFTRKIEHWLKKASEPHHNGDYWDYSFNWNQLEEMIHEECGFSFIPEEHGYDSRQDLRKDKVLAADLKKILVEQYNNVFSNIPEEYHDSVKNDLLLNAIDAEWMDHLTAMESLGDEVSLIAFSQKDPIVVYRHRAFGLFDNFRDRVTSRLLKNVAILRAQVPVA